MRACLEPLRKDPSKFAILIRCILIRKLKISNSKFETRARVGHYCASTGEIALPQTRRPFEALQHTSTNRQLTKRRMRTFITSPKAKNTNAMDDPP